MYILCVFSIDVFKREVMILDEVFIIYVFK
jgi:hypothetical protein